VSNDGKSLRHKAAGRARVACLLGGLDQILQHVWRGHVPQGHRRDFLWTYARVLAMNGHSKQTIRDCVNTLATAAAPRVDPMDVQHLVISASKPWNWNRSFSYKGLFLKFRITSEHQALITAWKRPKVDRAARRAALEQQRLAERANFDRSVARLRAEGLRRNEIAAQLECSVRTVASSLKGLRLTRHSVPRDVQSVMTLIGSDAKHPTALATEKFAHFGTHEKRRRQLIRKLDLVCTPVRTTMKTLEQHGVVACRMTVWRDQQAIQAEKPREAINSTEAPRSYHSVIDNIREDQHVESN